MTDQITIACVSPSLDASRFEAVVTLPTFRRPDHLVATLESLAAQKTDRPFAVIVMENDDEGRAGLAAATPLFESGRIEGLVIIAHERGNCSAYNAGWATALERFPAMRHLLVIDDDEIACEEWLERLVTAAETLSADMVGGPQMPRFEPGARAAFLRHPVFTPHYRETGRVPILFSSGNVVIRRTVLEAMGAPFLDTAFNFVGGGDADFYSRCRERGFTFGWCAEAPVFETVPARRTEFSWLNARSLRNGALSTMIEARRRVGPNAKAKRLAKSAALLAASPFRSLALGLRTGSPTIGLYHLQVAVGRLFGEFGHVNEQYRRPEQN
ncbi:glycosyltransferase family 2 protein [Aurantimonas sp. VKM B-3413]|uniref:glycosyltransferase family 2 protein n=1 Tax=Aurantimonas sp. VKM B-3413 TaxID=2779401 RepID=UPI001E2CA0CE|nr:glycosyltransferase [Aurantimonas sp. VKM B-3413]MCB8839595.1 glycosyltransferase [Aurantimonas sp. VKM B-3413]